MKKFIILILLSPLYLFCQQTNDSVVKFNSVKIERWNEKTKYFDIDNGQSSFNSTFIFNKDSSIDILIINPLNNHQRREKYVWISKLSKNLNGREWIEYNLAYKKVDEFTKVNVTIKNK
jgi:hypothetical protein